MVSSIKKLQIWTITVKGTTKAKIPVKDSIYTPLNTLRENIWQECANTKFKERETNNPYPIKESTRTGMSKYYHFHKCHDYNMNGCFQLNDVIEELIKKGHLSKYTQESRG